MKENPRGVVPGESTTAGVEVLAIDRTPPDSGAAPGKPGAAAGGAIASDRKVAIEHHGTKADGAMIVVCVAGRSKGMGLLTAP